MRIKLNEQWIEASEKITLFALKSAHNPAADVMIVNGFPRDTDCTLADADEVVFIVHGEIPSREQLETLMVARHTPGVHEKLKQATVGIAGCGGLGSAIAIALARIGVGHLILADFDIVEPSNLNRQQYFIDQIGIPKTSALSQNLMRINPYVNVTAHQLRLTPDNIPGIYGDVDVLTEAFDKPDQKTMLIESFGRHTADTPIVAASGLAGYGPGNAIQLHRFGPRLYVAGDLTAEAAPGMGLMSPRVGIAAHHQANAVVQLLLGQDPLVAQA